MLTRILILLIMLCLIQTQDSTRCPQASGLVVSGSISFSPTASTNTQFIPATSQTLTYNHSLSQPFNNQPGIAVSLSTFSSDASPFLMLTIKPLPLSSLSTLQLLVRFYQKYLTWQFITVHFFAEDRLDMEAQYYQIDTRYLGTNSTGKAVQISMPINSTFTTAVAIYFLHGFELVSLPVSSSSSVYTPFEVTITGKSSNKTNIVLVVSTASSSQILSMLVSYIAFENSTNLYSAGILQFDSGSAAALSAAVSLPTTILASIHGTSGFAMANSQTSTSFSATLANSAFSFAFSPNITYLNYHFFAVPDLSNPCYFCQGLPFDFNGTCVASCLGGAAPVNGQCTSCPQGQTYNGTHCVLLCSGGQIWNNLTNQCQCPNNLTWNGNSCISCPSGQIWDNTIGGCACPNPNDIWNGQTCQTITCGINQQLNQFTLMCQCIPTAFFDGVSCVVCTSPGSWNGSACTCPGGIWTGRTCSNCSTNEQYNSITNSCQCIPTAYYNGVQCIICQGGMIFSTTTNLCTCTSNTAWNGSQCINPCLSPFIYSNGQCLCPSGTIQTNNTCSVTTNNCSNGELWNGSTCVTISCTGGYIFNGSACIQYVQSCAVGTYWNGLTCVTFNIGCPSGSVWNGTYCAAVPACSEGYYLSGSQCLPFPLLCLPYYSWNGTHCLPVDGATSCSSTQLYNGTTCLTISCTLGRFWSSLYRQCICNQTSFWNGLGCVACANNQIYTRGGCGCPQGYFLVQEMCYSLQEVYCSYMGYASWNGSHCICNSGFQAVGTSCLCQGLISNSTCNPCYHLPNSILSNGQCQCKSEYYLSFGRCLPFGSNPAPTSCPPATLLLNNVCIPCSDGCLSCSSQALCLQCRPQFTYNYNTQTCLQNCGDGYRFSLSCDDGNNLNGDGCSSDCRIEADYICYGGSPNSKDYCTRYLPERVVVGMTGTAHMSGCIIVNLKTNYLPANLSDRAVACTDLCQNILEVVIISGDTAVTSITGQYFPGTHSFSYTLAFGREPIGQFIIQVTINPTMASIYFPNVISTDVFSFAINPAFLAIYTESDILA